MSDSASEMSKLARQIFDGKIGYNEAMSGIERIEQKYGSDAFPPVPFTKRDEPWDAAYLKDLESQNMSGACSKEFFMHIAEVRRELDRKNSQSKLLPLIIIAVAAVIIIFILVFAAKENAAFSAFKAILPADASNVWVNDSVTEENGIEIIKETDNEHHYKNIYSCE